jgi:c-di-AMP phosphodiesterase-like protein
MSLRGMVVARSAMRALRLAKSRGMSGVVMTALDHRLVSLPRQMEQMFYGDGVWLKAEHTRIRIRLLSLTIVRQYRTHLF